ncbi:unnamed protein product [Gordionus sp. m RMFG-2023]
MDIAIPKQVVEFFNNFQRCINEKKVNEIQNAYDEFSTIASNYFSEQKMPQVEILNKYFVVSGFFEYLYDQLRYRLLFNNRKGSLEEFEESYFMHCKLFTYIMKEDISRQIYLPKQWIWDILDSFIYQFIQYMHYQNSTDEINKLIWKSAYVFHLLMEFIQTAKFTKSSYYQMPKLFGIYSDVQFLKLNAIFGDFHLVLKSIEGIDSDQEMVMVHDCKATYYYYSAFASMMSREYQQSIRFCILLLNSLYKRDITPSLVFTHQNENFETKIKSILAISYVLFPCRLDENTNNQLREFMGDQYNNMNKGELEAYLYYFDNVYQDFLPLTPDHKQSNIKNVFIEEMKQCFCIPPLRTLLMGKKEEDVKILLLLFKQKMKEIKAATNTDDASEPVMTNTAPYLQLQPLPDFDFCLDKNGTLITFDTKIERKLGEYFIKQILRFDEINKNLKKFKNFG